MKWRPPILVLIGLSLVACSQVRLTPDSDTTQTAALHVENVCETISRDPPDKPAFKGMELYSWQTDDGQWAFNILYGTNRLKTIRETQSEGMDTAEVEKCLCSMAESENVSWINSALDDATGKMQPLPLPPEDIIKDIMARAENCRVNFNSPQ